MIWLWKKHENFQQREGKLSESSGRPCPLCGQQSSFRVVHVDRATNDIVAGPDPHNPQHTLHEYSCTCGWAEVNIPDESPDIDPRLRECSFDEFLDALNSGDGKISTAWDADYFTETADPYEEDSIYLSDPWDEDWE